jgi:thiol:disulfide interchange protein DsbD
MNRMIRSIASAAHSMPRTVALAVAAGLAVALLPNLLASQAGTADLSSQLGLAGGVGPGTFAVLYVAGLLTSLTPCVYPLIPITVGVFGARGRGVAGQETSRWRAAALSASYVAGIAITYSSLGLFAALSGRAFGSALGSPWVVGGLALFLFALAASMFGAFELDLPQALKQRLATVRGVGFLPAFGMGLVAGIIAAPCTGPVLAGVLAFVATTRSVVLGFWLLFTYALGLGTLFFILGVTSVRLPRSGAWMETVKSVFGAALLLAGVGLALPHLPKVALVAWSGPLVAATAGLLAALAVLGGALTLSFHGGARERLGKAASLAVLLGAVGLRLGWLGAAPDLQPIAWLHDEATAVAEARRTGKPILVDFFAEWCEACKQLDLHTFSDPAVQRLVADGFVPLKIDGTNETDEVQRMHGKYDVQGLPTVLVLGCKDPAVQKKLEPAAPAKVASCAPPAEGTAGRLTGFEPPDRFLERLRTARCPGDRC